MAICAVAWLVAHVRMLGRDEREKPQTMIRQLVTPLYGENTLQFYNERYKWLKTHTRTHRSDVTESFHQCPSWQTLTVCPHIHTHTVTRVIIMSSIMEHMCADVFQQTGATLRPPVEGQEPIPYRNLLPAKDPIQVALSKQFQTVLRKGWVDSRALHLFESLLNMGGVFWFTNNLVKVGGPSPDANSLRISVSLLQYKTTKGKQWNICVSSERHLLAGAAEGDPTGVGQSGGGVALQHLLPGHPADHPHPAGHHTAQLADRLRPLAQTHRPAWKGTGQVREAHYLIVECFLAACALVLTLLVTPQAVRVVCAQLLLLPPQRLFLGTSAKKATRRHRGKSIAPCYRCAVNAAHCGSHPLYSAFTDLTFTLFWLQDYNSLFPLDDTQPSKLMRLLSSNEDEPVALSSPGQSINTWLTT